MLILGLGLLAVLLSAGLGVWHIVKPLPNGISKVYPLREASQVAFFADQTYLDAQQQRQSKQSIFDEAMRLIGQAQQVIVLDMFLFNDFQGAQPERHRQLAAELTQALIARKQALPEIKILLISDPFNTLYGGVELPAFEALRAAGIEVVSTNLSKLRDSNPSWSGFWRWAIQWSGNNDQGGWLPSPVSSGEVTLRTYLQMLNFKANHRKTLVVDEGKVMTGMVMSANPHDGSSAHSNVALRFSGPLAIDLLNSELAVGRFSGLSLELEEALVQTADRFNRQALPETTPSDPTALSLQLLTESKIKTALLQAIHACQAEDRIDVAVFYFSQRDLVKALLAAHDRGVKIRVLLDPNKDAFGRQKNGIPNRQVALELHGAGVPVKWCDTHGEQCHSKMLLAHTPRQSTLILGSANYTRRNLNDLNLETSVQASGSAMAPAIANAQRFFDASWNNPPGYQFSVPYEAYADDSSLRYWQYRLMEASGWSTF